MSKIICDVCGTSYPETATQCPICGCARPGEIRATVSDNSEAGKASGYTYVKGGRFSKANVRKRNIAMQAGNDSTSADAAGSEGKNKWLVITAIVLLLAIVAVICYIVIHFFDPFGSNTLPSESTSPNASVSDPSTDSSTEPSTEPSIDPTDDTTLPSESGATEIPCTAIELVKSELQLLSVGEAYLIEVNPVPEDTTDILNFTSSDENVVSVRSDGMVTAVGGGEAVITINCGEITAICSVTCTIATEPSIGDFELKLNREDFTLFAKGASWDVYNGEIDADDITWSSDNEAVATVKAGVITAAGPGMTRIHAEYMGVKVSCIVRCEFPGSSGSGGVSEDGSSGGRYRISAEDVTIAVGETFTLTLKDGSGNVVSVDWNLSNSSVCSISGNTVTGLASGTTVIEVTYDGNYYSCIVRVK